MTDPLFLFSRTTFHAFVRSERVFDDILEISLTLEEYRVKY